MKLSIDFNIFWWALPSRDLALTVFF
jgi:hypothetical protein